MDVGRDLSKLSGFPPGIFVQPHLINEFLLGMIGKATRWQGNHFLCGLLPLLLRLDSAIWSIQGFLHFSMTHAVSSCNPIPFSDPSNLYPRPHNNQCENFGDSSCFNSVNSILYMGGMSGNGRLSRRRENMTAGV